LQRRGHDIGRGTGLEITLLVADLVSKLPESRVFEGEAYYISGHIRTWIKLVWFQVREEIHRTEVEEDLTEDIEHHCSGRSTDLVQVVEESPITLKSTKSHKKIH